MVVAPIRNEWRRVLGETAWRIEGSFEERFQGMIYGNISSEKGGTRVGSRSASGANVLKEKTRERVSYLIFGPGNVSCVYDELVASWNPNQTS